MYRPPSLTKAWEGAWSNMARKSRKPQLLTDEVTAVVPVLPKYNTAVYAGVNLGTKRTKPENTGVLPV